MKRNLFLHEDKNLFSRQKIFLFMKRIASVHEKTLQQQVSQAAGQTH